MPPQPAWQATPLQELLVRAAVLDGPAAVSAWEQWIAAVDLDTLESGSQRMLPLLYRNLLRLKVDHPALARFKGLYLNTWARNQTALREMGQLLAKLEDAGVATVVLKGAAVALRYYQDMGVRPMADFDILVPEGSVDTALKVLEADGWVPDSRTYAQLAMPYRENLHARNFGHPARKLGFDLHWHVLMTHLSAANDAWFWAAAEPTQLGGVQTHTLCPADQIVHLLIHAGIHEHGAQVRWLPDALVILDKTPDLDWARVVAQAERMAAASVIWPKLEYLRARWNIAVPQAAIDRLKSIPVSYRTRRLYDALATYPWEQRWSQIFWLLYSQYLSTLPPGSSSLRPLGFLRYLQHRWLVDSPWAMMRGGWARIVERRTRQDAAAVQPPGSST